MARKEIKEIKDMDAYEKLVEGFYLIGEGLQESAEDGKNYPIKLLISKLIGKMGFNNPDALEELSMIRFAVENNDYTLEKLTAQVVGAQAEEVEETPEKKDVAKAD